jgi:ABC-2 type transport system ATP-binding protein
MGQPLPANTNVSPPPLAPVAPPRTPVAPPSPSGGSASQTIGEPAVLLDNVSKQFGKQEVLHDINMRMPWGEILGMIGPSGSGKTTTIRMMLGMLKPSGGTARTFGRDPARLRRSDRERIGYMPQDFVLYPALTVTENLRFAASLYGIPWWEAGHRAKELLPYVDLTEAANRRAEDLSGGMRRRLSLAATLMHDPDFLVLDEPTAGIDPILRTSIWDGLRQWRDQGKTMVVTTQYVTEAEYCDSVIMIDEGTIIASGPPAELRRQASGGDMIDIEFEQPRPDIAMRLRSLPFVHDVEPLERPNAIRVIVDEIAADLPQLQQYCDREEGGCVSMEPHVPSFDDVFVRLVSQARGAEKERASGDTHDHA